MPFGAFQPPKPMGRFRCGRSGQASAHRCQGTAQPRQTLCHPRAYRGDLRSGCDQRYVDGHECSHAAQSRRKLRVICSSADLSSQKCFPAALLTVTLRSGSAETRSTEANCCVGGVGLTGLVGDPPKPDPGPLFEPDPDWIQNQTHYSNQNQTQSSTQNQTPSSNQIQTQN